MPLLLLRVHETIFKALQKTQIKLKRETVKRQVLEPKSSSVTASTQIPRVYSPSLLRRTDARPPHFRRTRERARRRRDQIGGKRCSLTKSFQRRRVTLRTDRLPQTPPPHPHPLDRQRSTQPTLLPRGETYWLRTYQPIQPQGNPTNLLRSARGGPMVYEPTR